MPISTYLYIGIALGTAFITHRVDGYYSEKSKVEAIQTALNTQTEEINKQAVISQQTQKDKDDLQNRYDSAIAELRGLRQPSAADNQPAAPTIPSQGLRLLESDAEVLVQFARQCQATEIERNDVINKYNALMVK
jgi:hypothetical protein